MSAYLKASELARSIVESNECKRVLSLKQIIDKNPEYKNKIQNLKSIQENIKMTLSSGKQPSKTHTEKLKNLYNEILKNQDMKAYLEAEKTFNEYISRIFKMVGDKIEESIK